MLMLQPLAQSIAADSARHRSHEMVDGSNEVRARLQAFEQAWNRGDIPAVTSQYSPFLVAIFKSNYYDYVQYINAVVADMSKRDRQRMSLEIQTIRPLGIDYVLANGRVHMFSKESSEQSALFTVIYMRSHGLWKFIYAHS
jgi:ketosteroid isomerase-like protein